MPLLRKIEIEEGKDSVLPENYATRAPYMKLIDYSDLSYSKELDSIQDIEVGKQLLLYSLREYHRTSKIKEIVSVEEDKVIFRTQTSLYELSGD